MRKLFNWEELAGKSIARCEFEMINHHSLRIFFKEGCWSEIMSFKPAQYPTIRSKMDIYDEPNEVLSCSFLTGRNIIGVYFKDRPTPDTVYWDSYVELMLDDGFSIYLMSEDGHTPLALIDTFDPG